MMTHEELTIIMIFDHDNYLEETWTSPRSKGEIICINYFYLSFKSPRSGGEIIEPNTILQIAFFAGGISLLLLGTKAR